MTGNVALDVVIGIVFVYLLYSLYATIAMELITSVLELRSKNLRFAIKRMLADEKTYSSEFKKAMANVATTFLRSMGRSANIGDKDLYEKFMNQPNIKFLGSGGLGGKPSYLTADNFSKALIDSIRIDDPEFNLMTTIGIGVETKLKDGSATKEHLVSLMRDANNDPVKFKILLENWFNDTMERATGWFKQTTQVALLIIGFVLAISFNVDSITIIKKLSKDKDAREQMVKLATEFTKNNQQLPGTTTATTDTAEKKTDSARFAELMQIKESLEEEIAESRSILQSSWYLPAEVAYHLVQPDSLDADSLQIILPKKDSLHRDSVKLLLNNDSGFILLHKLVDTGIIKRQFGPKDFIEMKGNKLTINRPFYKLAYIFSKGRFWGYLLTMLALSLGAPFWFDLLNKLVKLRTGKQVNETGSAATDNRSILNKDTLNRVG
jgi:hypothetical protein